MEVRIGVQMAPRDVVVNTDMPADKLTEQVKKALSEADGVLELTDNKGRQVMVPTSKVAYVEIGAPHEKRVGFGTD